MSNPQMGASYQDSSLTTFATIQVGKIIVRREKPNELTVTRQITKPGFEKTVYEELYSELSGRLKKVENKNGDFGWECKLTFDTSVEDVEEKWIITMSLNSGPSDCLFKRLREAKKYEFHKIMVGSSDYINKKGEKKVNYWLSLQVWDGGKWRKIESAHTKELPNGLPQAKEVMVNGKPVWDKTELFNFYHSLATFFNLDENETKQPVYAPKADAQTQNQNQELCENEFEDELPF